VDNYSASEVKATVAVNMGKTHPSSLVVKQTCSSVAVKSYKAVKILWIIVSLLRFNNKIQQKQ
jgi:hypothetical protein